jgi:hypothetical protein
VGVGPGSAPGGDGWGAGGFWTAEVWLTGETEPPARLGSALALRLASARSRSPLIASRMSFLRLSLGTARDSARALGCPKVENQRVLPRFFAVRQLERVPRTACYRKLFRVRSGWIGSRM